MTKEIRERYDDARSAWSEWRSRALEDLRFSNPADPQQWPQEAITARGRDRAKLTFDQTNQYIEQVVNDARQNKPSIDILPGDSFASDKAAEYYGGLVRQIEYASRAQIAYDTAIDYAARIGLGFILVVPELSNARLNDHDIRIKSVVDPLAVTLDPDSVEPDGQDADCGWLDTRMSESAYRRRWPKAKLPKGGDGRFYDGKGVTVSQYFERTYAEKNIIVTMGDGREFSEDDYHAESQRQGYALPVHTTYKQATPQVKWSWWNGDDILEEADYPAPYIGIVPVYGNVLWVDGKRQICGMTRRMMDACRAYNYARTAEVEATALQPKAPFIGPAAAVARYQSLWDNANRENRSFLPYDHLTVDGEALPPPKRQDPPQIGAAFPMLSQQALLDIEASVGMHKASLGQNSNAKSGLAIGKLQREGDTSTFHYQDNQVRSIEQVGRICVALIPTYFDREKVARIMKVDGKPAAVKVAPQIQTPHADGDDGIPLWNPGVGTYDVRVKAGPSYTTMRQELQDRLTQLGQSNPPLAAALAPLILQLADVPGGDKAIRVALAMLPPEVRSAYDDDDAQPPQVPPEMLQEMQQLAAAFQQCQELLQQATARVQELEADAQGKFNDTLIRAYDSETKRIQALGTGMTPEQVQALAMQTVIQALQNAAPEPIPPDGMQPQPFPQEPPPGGFFAPAEEQGQQFPPEMAATGANPGLGEPPLGA